MALTYVDFQLSGTYNIDETYLDSNQTGFMRLFVSTDNSNFTEITTTPFETINGSWFFNSFGESVFQANAGDTVYIKAELITPDADTTSITLTSGVMTASVTGTLVSATLNFTDGNSFSFTGVDPETAYSFTLEEYQTHFIAFTHYPYGADTFGTIFGDGMPDIMFIRDALENQYFDSDLIDFSKGYKIYINGATPIDFSYDGNPVDLSVTTITINGNILNLIPYYLDDDTFTNSFNFIIEALS
jgi:hypothetical protein